MDINTDLGCRRASDPKATLAIAQSQTSNSLRWQSTHFMLLPSDSMAYKCPSSVALVTDIILAPIRAWPGMGWQSQDWLTHQAACLHKPGPRWAWSLSCWLSPKLIIPILYTHSTTSAWLTDLFCKVEYSYRVGLLIKVKERRVAKSTPISRSTQDCSMSMWTVDPPILNLYVIEVFEERISVWFYISWSHTNKHKCGNYYIELGIFLFILQSSQNEFSWPIHLNESLNSLNKHYRHLLSYSVFSDLKKSYSCSSWSHLWSSLIIKPTMTTESTDLCYMFLPCSAGQNSSSWQLNIC